MKSTSSTAYSKAKESDVLNKAGEGLKRAGTVVASTGSSVKEKI